MLFTLLFLGLKVGAGFVAGLLVGRKNPSLAAAAAKVAEAAKQKAADAVAKVEQK